MGHIHTKKNSFICIILLFTIISCKINRVVESNYYNVYKIDSVKNYYLIYIKGGDANFKIVAKKEVKKTRCNQIKVNESYPNFILQKLIDPAKYIPRNTEVSNSLIFVPDCVKMDDSTEICRDRGMDNIYSSSNLVGLCYIP